MNYLIGHDTKADLYEITKEGYKKIAEMHQEKITDQDKIITWLITSTILFAITSAILLSAWLTHFGG